MQFKVTQKNTRQSSRKVRLVANTVKDLSLEMAIKQLAVIERRATLVLLKTIKQAIANAKNNHGVNADNLKIKEILVNEGPRYKRFRAVSRGRAHNIVKKTCHISVTLEEKKAGVAKTKPVVKKAVAKKSVAITKKESADNKAKSTLRADTKVNMKLVGKNQSSKMTNIASTQKTTVRKSTSK
jgi:large subunit ribosomal protein L22